MSTVTPNTEKKVWCPLCESPMRREAYHYQCIANQLHKCLIDKEYERYKSGEKDMQWLRWRMKVRLGKLVSGR